VSEFNTHWLEMVIQLCRVQIQREREELVMASSPKMRGALEALKKMHHHAEEEAVKLTRRIEGETMPALVEGFKTAHANVDGMHGIVDEIKEFADELKKTNGGDPLEDSEKSYTEVAPRSSDVAKQ
jgi:hypothetical protein